MKPLLSLLLVIVISATTSAQQLTVESVAGTTLGTQCDGNPSLSFRTRAGTSTIRVIRIRNIQGTAGMKEAVDFKIYLSGMSNVQNSSWTVIDSAATANQIDDIFNNSNATATTAMTCGTSALILSGHLGSPDPSADPDPDRKTYYIRYKPTVASPAFDNTVLRFVRCNAGSDCDGTAGINKVLDLPLGGEVVQEEGFLVSLVLDRSGSMSAVRSTGAPSRATSLRNATSYFLGLMQTRAMATTPVNIPDDVLHVVTFDNLVENLSWASTTPATANTANLTAFRSAIGSHSQLDPRGTTAIGNAVHSTATTISSVGSQSRKIILFTDGEQNISSPHSIMMGASNPPNISGIHSIHTVGIGSEIGSSFQMNLRAYAQAHSGTYTYIQELASTPTVDFALEKAYLRIFNDLIAWSGVIDPLFTVTTDTIKVVTSAHVTSSDGQAIFSVFEDQRIKKFYTLSMQSPKGEILTNGAMASGITGTVVDGETFSIFKADFTTANDISDYSGEWKLVLTPSNKERMVAPIGFSASVLSNLKLSLGTATGTSLPGEPLKIAIDLKEGDAILSKINSIGITVKDPLGNVHPVSAVRDTQGTWYGTFNHTNDAGTYEVFSRVVFKNLAGELATRESTSYVAYGTPMAAPSQPDRCFSCNGLYITIVLVVIALIILLWLIRVAILKSRNS